MAKASVHEPEKLTRYAFGELDTVERNAVREHLARCAKCEEYVSFITRFNAALRDTRSESVGQTEACPDTTLIVDLEAGELSGKIAEHVRAHVLFCSDCRQEFYALRRLRSPNWARVVINAVQGALKCATLIGSAELAEPAYVGVREAKGSEPEDRVHLEDMVSDPDSRETSRLQILIEPVPGRSEASIGLGVQPPQPSWTAELLDANEGAIASAPLSREENPIGSSLLYGRYTLKVRKDGEDLATFAIEIRAVEDL